MAIPSYEQTTPVSNEQVKKIMEDDPYNNSSNGDDLYGDAEMIDESYFVDSDIDADDEDNYDPYKNVGNENVSMIYVNPEWGTYTSTEFDDLNVTSTDDGKITGAGGSTTNSSVPTGGSTNPANTIPKPSNITVTQLKQIFKKKKYKWVEPFQIIGIRNADKPNQWNDTMLVVYGDEVEEFDCTTKPGVTHLKKPPVSKGCAILKEGQFTYRLGYHKQSNSSRYRALNPTYNLPVHRDPTKDGTFHYNINSGTGQGINIHRGAGADARYGPYTIKNPGSGVNNWSAGCQVLHYYPDWQRFISLCEKYESKLDKGHFQYTLLNASDF